MGVVGKSIGTAKVTTKGQITVPGAVRELLNVTAGDHLDFVLDRGGRIEIRVRKHKSILDVALKYQLRMPEGAKTIEDLIDCAVTDAVAERFRRSRGDQNK